MLNWESMISILTQVLLSSRRERTESSAVEMPFVLRKLVLTVGKLEEVKTVW